MTNSSYLSCRSKVILLLASALLAAGAHGAQPGAAGYNFSYATKGDRSVWPTQVFDNGSETYFQFNPDRTIPAIFALTPCGNRVLITPRSQGPYLVVPGLYKNYSLQLGARSSTVDYAGTQEIPLEESIANETNCANAPPASGVASGAREYGAVMPTLGDPAASPRPTGLTQARSVVESAKRGANDKLAVVDRKKTDPEGTKTVAMAAAVAPVPAKPEECPFVISPSDTKLSEVLERWATKGGYQLAWEITGEEPVISLTAQFCGKTFNEALEILLSSYDDTTPMKAIHWKQNNAIQLVSGSK